jgi:putative flippase GtrA
MPRLLREFLAYGLASAVALCVDAGLLYALTQYAGWHYLMAAAASFVAGAAVAYLLSVRLAFHNHRLRNRTVEFTSFVLLGLAGVAVNSLVLQVAHGELGIPLLIAKAISAGFTFLTNFALRRQFLFRPQAKDNHDTQGATAG